jgi:Uri superfamily endonuclease
MGQVFLQVLCISPVSIIPPGLYTHIPSRGGKLGPLVAAVQRHYDDDDDDHHHHVDVRLCL